MDRPPQPADMVTYQFEVDDDVWTAWKNTVPRSKTLEQRLVELIEADTDGRVQPPTDPDAPADTDGGVPERGPRTEPAGADVAVSDEETPARTDELADLPDTVDRKDALDAVERVCEFLQTDGPASSREIVAAVMPDHPLGYSVPEIEDGELAVDRYRGAWWRKIVKPALDASPTVNYRDNYSDYQWVGENQ